MNMAKRDVIPFGWTPLMWAKHNYDFANEAIYGLKAIRKQEGLTHDECRRLKIRYGQRKYWEKKIDLLRSK
jgi:hypothetical protein